LPVASRNVQTLDLPILANRKLTPETFLLSFESEALADTVLPGQFLMLSIPDLLDPLLPRPFAVFDVQEHRVDVLYRLVGKGTHLLARMHPGDRLRVLGPLGNSYTLDRKAGSVLVVAGGIGIASVYFLLRHLSLKGEVDVTLLYGAATRTALIPLEGLKGDRLHIQVATEDGGEGFKGNVCELLGTRLKARQDAEEDDSPAFACGPPAMLEETARILEAHGIRAQFSLESRMACGYGVCQGCVIRTRDAGSKTGPPHQKVCTEGPIFDARDVAWTSLIRRD